MRETFLAKGKRGHAFLREVEGKTLLVKRKNPASVVDTIANEAYFTHFLNGVGVGPMFFSYDESVGELVRAYVDGLEFRKWLPTAERAAVKRVLLSVLRQCAVMDGVGVNKEEMTRPWKHIIVTPAGEAILIDFERCRETRLPKNVTQFCQFLTSSVLAAHLKKLNILIKKENILELAKQYKQNIRDNNQNENNKIFNEIITVLNNA